MVANQITQLGFNKRSSSAIVTVCDGHIVEVEWSKEELVGQSIIQTALTNKTLRLELSYRVPTMLRQESGPMMEPATHTGLTHPPSVQVISDEFACLLIAI